MLIKCANRSPYSRLFSNANHYINQVLRCRSVSTKPKFEANLYDEIQNQFESGIRHRGHCGRRAHDTVSLPSKLELAANRVIQKYNCMQFKEDIYQMFDTVFNHQLPAEPQEVQNKSREIKERIAAKDKINLKSLTEEERVEVMAKRNQKLEKQLKDSLLNHQPIEYNDYSSVVYMTARLPANYATLFSIFNEIRKESPDFTPKTLFDFGSGVGTTLWAANQVWLKGFDETFCVDICSEMNDLSRLLLQGGEENKKMIYDPVFYRQYLPVSHTIKYDLVVSAFSLLDIPDAKNRIHVIENLWHKTQDMLVIAEHGSRAGFAAVLEARNLVLQLSGHKVTAHFLYNPDDTQISTDQTTTDATIVAPCSHDLTCPRQSTKGPVLCNFEVTYNPLQFGQKKAVVGRERYSYVVLRKGTNQPVGPRIVQPVLTGHNKAICRMCCSDGEIKELIITKNNHERHAYKCAKISRWGDKFPAHIRQKDINQDIENTNQDIKE